jgi:hypothetical protein
MKIEVKLTEVEAFIMSCYNVNVGLKNIEEGKIEVKYLATADLTIKHLKDDIVTIVYEVNGIVDLLAKGANFFLSKKFDKMPFEWYPKTSEVIVDLRKVEEFNHLLNYFHVNDIRIVEGNIVVILNTRLTIENT